GRRRQRRAPGRDWLPVGRAHDLVVDRKRLRRRLALLALLYDAVEIFGAFAGLTRHDADRHVLDDAIRPHAEVGEAIFVAHLLARAEQAEVGGRGLRAVALDVPVHHVAGGEWV